MQEAVQYYGFKLLTPIFCLDSNPKALNYALLCSLMPNVKCITVWDLSEGTGRKSQSVEISKAFVPSIIQAIVLDTRLEAFHILTPFIPNSRSLKDWINEHQLLFRKYGWILKQDDAFKHPRRRWRAKNALLIKKL
eukprot:745867_1